MSTLDKKHKRLAEILYEAKQLEREIQEEELRIKKEFRDKTDKDLCECGHARHRHGKSTSINYTDGACIDCKCRNFLMK